jgi:hypothetical protein
LKGLGAFPRGKGYPLASSEADYRGDRIQWIAPSEKDISTDTLENRLWAAADQLRANSGLTFL